MSSRQSIILTSKNPLGALEGYLAAGFLRPVEDFLREQSDWVYKLEGAEKSRCESVISGVAELQSLEAVHGIGSAIDIEHPFAAKMLRLN